MVLETADDLAGLSDRAASPRRRGGAERGHPGEYAVTLVAVERRTVPHVLDPA